MKLDRQIKVALLATLAVAAAVATAGCGSNFASADAASTQQTIKTGLSSATDSTGAATQSGQLGDTLNAKLSEMKIDTPTTAVKAGKVHFTADNTGTLVHELIVLKTDKPASQLGTGQKLNEKDSVGEISELKPGASGKVTLDLKPGHYALICNVPGHYMAGMHRDLTVK
jgi:uncharacterized cupredoxin-like copper-binding protein